MRQTPMDQASEQDTDDISDEDVLAAMRAIPGYLDITPADFRILYEFALDQARHRAFAHVRAERLMHTGIEPVRADHMLDEAARTLWRPRA